MKKWIEHFLLLLLLFAQKTSPECYPSCHWQMGSWPLIGHTSHVTLKLSSDWSQCCHDPGLRVQMSEKRRVKPFQSSDQNCVLPAVTWVWTTAHGPSHTQTCDTWRWVSRLFDVYKWQQDQQRKNAFHVYRWLKVSGLLNLNWIEVMYLEVCLLWQKILTHSPRSTP